MSKILLKKLIMTSVIAASAIGYIAFQARTQAFKSTETNYSFSMEKFSPGYTDANANDNKDYDEDTSLLGQSGGFSTSRVGR